MDQTGLKTFNGREQLFLKPMLVDLYNSFTYEFWIKPTAAHEIVSESLTGISGLQGQNYIVAPWYGQIETQAGVGISIGTNGISIFEHTAVHLPATLVYQVLIDNWTHIAIVYEEKTPFLYINGNFIKKGLTSTKEFLFPSGVFGGFDYGYYKGEICNLRVWSYARTETEIKAGMHRKIDENEYGLYINEYFQIKDNTSNVLFIFGHYRPDYEYLLFPVANRLVKKGLSVSILIHNKYSTNLSMLSSEVKLIYEEQIFSNKVFSQRDEHRITTLLKILRPKFICSIHFSLNQDDLNAIKSLINPPICALIQHGVLRYFDNTHDYHGADIVFLWGEYDKLILNQMDDVPPSIVLGNPKIEQIKKDLKVRLKERKGNLAKNTKKANKDFKILYIFTADPENNHVIKANFELFIEGISQMQNSEVIYKMHPSIHPSASFEFYQGYIFKNYIDKGIIKQEQILRDGDIYDLIEEADIVIGDFSTSIYDAAALNKPVIKICHSIIEEKYLKFHNAKTTKELIDIIKRLQTDQTYYAEFMKLQKRYLEDVYYKINGSAKRIAEYIHNLLG